MGSYSPDPEHEWLSGYELGAAAGVRSLLGRLRRQLRPFQLSLDADGRVSPAGHFEDAEDEAPSRARPPASNDFECGWWQGWADARLTLLSRIRPTLLEHQLFVTDEGTVTTLAAASRAIGRFRRPSEDPLTDQAIHAFLDAAESGTWPNRRGNTEGARARSTRRRQTALGAAVILGAASVYFALLSPLGSKDPPTPSGTGPAGWHDATSDTREQLLSLDRLFTDALHERAWELLHTFVCARVESLGSTQKDLVLLRYLCDRRLTPFATDVLSALDRPGLHPEARRLILELALMIPPRGRRSLELARRCEAIDTRAWDPKNQELLLRLSDWVIYP